MSRHTPTSPALLHDGLLARAAADSLRKLDPRQLMRNPVIFVTEVVALLVAVLWIGDLRAGSGQALFTGQIAAWLVFTVLFATFAEAIAEGRGKAQAASLRQSRSDVVAHRFLTRDMMDGLTENVGASDLVPGDIVLVEAGGIIPLDGEIIEGGAAVNEAAITGESAPVTREAGGDRSAVTGGTTVLSDAIRVRITAAPGETFIDRMIALVEGAARQRTPNEIALSLVLSAFTLVFLIVTATLWPLARYTERYVAEAQGLPDLQSLGTDIPTLVALLVCLIPTTIGALLAAIGIAGMDRALRANIIAKSGKAVEVAGDVAVPSGPSDGPAHRAHRASCRFDACGTACSA